MKKYKTIFKKHGALIISLITAIAMIVSALLFKGTGYENAWLYILAVGLALGGVFEAYSKNQDRQ